MKVDKYDMNILLLYYYNMFYSKPSTPYFILLKLIKKKNKIKQLFYLYEIRIFSI